MRAVLEQSWQRLAQSGQYVLGQLAVFEGGFTQDAAVTIAGASPDDLTLLVESSMVRVASPGRYQMHDLLRQFAAEQHVDQDSAHEAHSRYFATFAQARYAAFLDKRYPEAIEDLSVERDNLRAAWRWLMGRLHVGQRLDSTLERLAALVHPLAWFYRELALNWEGKAVFDAACTAVVTLLGQTGWPSQRVQQMRVLLARLQIRLASFLYVLGEYDLVDRAIAAALPVVRVEKLAEEEGLALEVAARAHLRRGNHQASRTAAERSMALARQTGNDLQATDAQVLLARAAADEGDYDSAVRMHQDTGSRIAG
jgi:tetratricopeptide (TPR) repeat protein